MSGDNVTPPRRGEGVTRRFRLFVALDLPAEVRAALPVPGAPWRPVAPEKLHVTLEFLGSVADPGPVVATLAQPPAAPLAVAEAVLLPPRRPRVLAVRLEDSTGAITAFQARLAAALAAAGVHQAEARPWLPHVTIARTRERVRRGAPVPDVESLTFTCPTMTLYRSAGGRYEPLAQLPAQS